MFKKIIFISAIVINVTLMMSCEKSVVEYDDKGTIPKSTTPTSFATDIQPIFTSKCISCHGGTVSPNLTNDKAYTSINTSKYINISDPSTSLIYTKLTATGSSHEGRASASEASKLLKWIKEGAQNN